MQITSTPTTVHFGGIKRTLQTSVMGFALLGPAGASQASEIPDVQDKVEIGRVQVSHWQAKLDRDLMKAALKNDEEAAQAALNEGASPDAKDEDNTTVLMHVSLKGYTKIAELLLDRGADAHLQNNFGFNALMNASANCHSKIVSLLLEERGVDPDVQNNDGLTSLMFASAGGCVKDVKALLEAGADPTIKDNAGRTAREQTQDPKIKEILKKAEEEFQSNR